jgi:hypothetical protein
VKYVEFLVRICFAKNVKERAEEGKKKKNKKPGIVIIQSR